MGVNQSFYLHAVHSFFFFYELGLGLSDHLIGNSKEENPGLATCKFMIYIKRDIDQILRKKIQEENDK